MYGGLVGKENDNLSIYLEPVLRPALLLLHTHMKHVNRNSNCEAKLILKHRRKNWGHKGHVLPLHFS